ncbi:MAG TPA: isocitrate lyase/phosphoenolpyruvate mutase family protein [Vicinamibacteria bacterium]|nr:isocitrate lyase/phosphoenolpyruvate mutase family protein [Vicinamibacteria bacterium]
MELSRKAEAFKALHAGPSPLVLLNAWDAASAAVFARAGAPALGTTSAGVAWSAGYTDGEDMPFADLVRVVERICRVVSVPVSVDIERGFGADAAAVARNVSALMDAGAIGVNIEDGFDPAAGALRPSSVVADRIAAIRTMAAARGVPLFINARTDVFFLPAGHPQRRLEEAAIRLSEYARAGADGAFAPGLIDCGEIAQLVARIERPLNVYAGYAGVPPVAELAASGARRISVGCGPLQGLLGQAEAMAQEILERGRYDLMLRDALDAGSVNGLFSR